MEAFSPRKTIQGITAAPFIQAIQVSMQKRQRLDGSAELITRRKKGKDKNSGLLKKSKRLQKYGP